VSVSGASVIQSGAEFFWRQILESDRTVFYFTTESGDHVIKILICDWSVINVVVVFVCWSCKFCLYFRLLKLFNLFNLFSLFNMSWTDSEIESLITFYSSMLVSGARNLATGIKNRRQKPTPVFWRRFLERVSLALDIDATTEYYLSAFHAEAKRLYDSNFLIRVKSVLLLAWFSICLQLQCPLVN